MSGVLYVRVDGTWVAAVKQVLIDGVWMPVGEPAP